MKTLNPYRSNEFCVNWEDNLLATSMGDAFEVGKDDTLRQVRELLDEAENPWDCPHSRAFPDGVNAKRKYAFNYAIQAIKALLEE